MNSGAYDDMSVDKIHQAEISSDPRPEEIAAMQQEVLEYAQENSYFSANVHA